MKEKIKTALDQSTIERNKKLYNSFFDESVKAYLILQIKFMLICICSLGFAYPWALCMKYRAKYHHTVICGNRLKIIVRSHALAPHSIWLWCVTSFPRGLYSLFLQV